jgi:hypothetical protein
MFLFGGWEIRSLHSLQIFQLVRIYGLSRFTLIEQKINIAKQHRPGALLTTQ